VVSPLALLSAHDAPAIPAAPYLAESNPPLNRFIVRALRRQYGAFLKPANTLRRELGLPSGGNILLRAAHSPTLALGLFSPHLAPPQPDWPQSLRAVGFCFASLHQSLAGSVRRFLQAGEPPLLFLSATFSHHEENDELAHWMSTALAACQQLGARALFLGPPERLGENFLSIPYAPLAEVLPGVRAMVHEGGIGTLALGLRAGTPMLLSPMAHDQPDTARMATRAGIARVLSRHEFKAGKLAAELKSLLSDEGLKARVLALRNQILAEPGAAGAAREIAQLLN
jgi:UDP:flavonoid glycosyltransferase YjiC (YdhE family)